MDAVAEAVTAAAADASAPLYVGFSGGRDSTVLLHAVSECRRDEVTAVHVHHGLHSDADAWQTHCETVARELGVDFVAHRVAVGGRGSVEAAARAARYRAFAGLLDQSGGTLLLAHHRHDQSETVLLRLLQGRGLYGMPRCRRLGRGLLVRPLLDLEPAAVEHYACTRSLHWVDDPSNADRRLDRSFLRQDVLPLLRRHFPKVDEALLDAMRRHAIAEERLRRSLASETPALLPLAEVRGLVPSEAVELLRLWLTTAGQPAPTRRSLLEFLRQLRDGRRHMQPRLEVAGGELRVHGDALHLVRYTPALAGPYPVALPGVTQLPHGRLEVREGDGFHPSGPVEARFRRGGERVLIRGRHRRVKSLFQDAGIPPWQRDRWPLLFDAAGLVAVPEVAQRDDPNLAGTRYIVRWRPGEDSRSPA